MRLTEQSIKGLPAPASGNKIFYDSDLAGFGLRITAAGARSFVLEFRIAGRRRRITIGQAPAWSVKAARIRAAELRREVDQGRDPMSEREAQRSAPMMSELLQRFLDEHCEAHNKRRTRLEARHLIHGTRRQPPRTPFDGTVGKYFARMQVGAVTRADVMKFHGGLRSTPYQANRALALLSKAFGLAEVWGLRPEGTSPCRIVKRFREEKRSRYLSAEELGRLGQALEAADQPAAVAVIKLLLSTGCRVGEVLALRWTDVDLKAGVAHLRDSKTGPRDVPLSVPALAALAGMPRNDGPVFPGMSYTTFSRHWAAIRDAAGLLNARPHDLRHTVGTFLGAAGFNAFTVRDALGHKTLSMTSRYVHSTDPVRQATEAVSQTIAAALKGDKADVIALPKRSKP